MKWSASHGCMRATAGDAYYGPSCPVCSSPKDAQALLCRTCRAEAQRTPDFWARRTCECGGPKSPYREKCMTCEYERRRVVLPARDKSGEFVLA